MENFTCMQYFVFSVMQLNKSNLMMYPWLFLQDQYRFWRCHEEFCPKIRPRQLDANRCLTKTAKKFRRKTTKFIQAQFRRAGYLLRNMRGRAEKEWIRETTLSVYTLYTNATALNIFSCLKPKYSFGKWWKLKISLMGMVHKSCMSSQSPVNLFVQNHQFS